MLLQVMNLGIAEMILILFGIVFWAGIIAVIVYLLKLLLRRNKELVYIPIATNNEASASNSKSEKDTNIVLDQNQKIALPQQKEIRYVSVGDIVRCEASDNYTFFILQGDEKILISRSLKEFSDSLKPYGFMRSHQSHLVNHKYVKSWLKEDGGVLLLFNGDKVPVSKPNREIVKEILGGYFIS